MTVLCTFVPVAGEAIGGVTIASEVEFQSWLAGGLPKDTKNELSRQMTVSRTRWIQGLGAGAQFDFIYVIWINNLLAWQGLANIPWNHTMDAAAMNFDWNQVLLPTQLDTGLCSNSMGEFPDQNANLELMIRDPVEKLTESIRLAMESRVYVYPSCFVSFIRKHMLISK